MVTAVPQSERDLAKIVFSLRQLSDDFNFVGTWTPALTFATPGDLNVVYSNQTGRYMKIGRLVTLWFTVQTSTFTYTTASGNLRLGTLPVTAQSLNLRPQAALSWQGITNAGFTDLTLQLGTNAPTFFEFRMYASGAGFSTITTTEVPSAGSVLFQGNIQYIAAL